MFVTMFNLMFASLFLLVSTNGQIIDKLLDPVIDVNFIAYEGLWLNALTSKNVWPGQNSSFCVRAKYDLISTDPVAMFSVVNEYNAMSPSGEVRGGAGILTQSSSPMPQGSLTVTFAGMSQEFEYRIIKLSTIQNSQYTWAVIYSPVMDVIFVNYRQDTDFDNADNDLDALGVYLNSLPLTPKIPLLTKAEILSSVSQLQPAQCDYTINL